MEFKSDPISIAKLTNVQQATGLVASRYIQPAVAGMLLAELPAVGSDSRDSMADNMADTFLKGMVYTVCLLV